jgi:hypothetical protein
VPPTVTRGLPDPISATNLEMDAPDGGWSLKNVHRRRRRGEASFSLTLLDLDEDMVAQERDGRRHRACSRGRGLPSPRVVERERARPPCVVERVRHHPWWKKISHLAVHPISSSRAPSLAARRGSVERGRGGCRASHRG